MWAYVEIICNFHPSRARNYATTIISKLNNFAEVLAVRVHVDVYMATAALRSITGESLCDTGHVTLFTTYQPTTTKSDHFKPSILVFFLRLRRKKTSMEKILTTPLAVEDIELVMLGVRYDPAIRSYTVTLRVSALPGRETSSLRTLWLGRCDPTKQIC